MKLCDYYKAKPPYTLIFILLAAILAAILKMAAILKIEDGSIAEICWNTFNYKCAKFVAFIKKWTIKSPYDPTIPLYAAIACVYPFYDVLPLEKFDYVMEMYRQKENRKENGEFIELHVTCAIIYSWKLCQWCWAGFTCTFLSFLWQNQVLFKFIYVSYPKWLRTKISVIWNWICIYKSMK